MGHKIWKCILCTPNTSLHFPIVRAAYWASSSGGVAEERDAMQFSTHRTYGRGAFVFVSVPWRERRGGGLRRRGGTFVGARVRGTTFVTPRIRHVVHSRRLTRMHAGAHVHGHCGCGVKESHHGERFAGAENVLALRDNLGVTLVSAGCVVLGAISTVVPGISALGIVALIVAGMLTLFPAVVASLIQLRRAPLAAIDVHVLMSVAALICVCTGAVVEGVLLSTLYALSHASERAMTARAARELRGLRALAPAIALRMRTTDGTPEEIALEDVVVGDLVLVRAGELVPCDGEVDVGSSGALIAVPHLTGEATPRSVGVGDGVPAGARSLDAPLLIRVTRIGSDSALARIERLAADAQKNQPRLLSFFDRFGQAYSRTVLILCALLAFGLPSLRPSVPYFGHDGSMKRALSFLVVTSPCALVIAAPLAHVATLSASARRGVLVKSGAHAIEHAARARAVLFDKTGTLTTGKLSLVGVSQLARVAAGVGGKALRESSDGWALVSESKLRELVSVAASLERNAVHPLAKAILAKAKALDVPFFTTHDVNTVAGQGIEGVVSCTNANGDFMMSLSRIGRASFAAPDHVAVQRVAEFAGEAGETVSVLEHDGEHFMLRFRDEVRVASSDTIARLAKSGLQMIVLTGDSHGAAAHVANELGGGFEVVHDATPESKLEYVRAVTGQMGMQKHTAIMVGDGINDAPALAAAHVGVAMGLTSATAVHSADVVLMRESLEDLRWFLERSRQTEEIVTQNVVLALVLMLAAALPIVHASLPLWLAVLMHEGGTIIVGANSLRLLR